MNLKLGAGKSLTSAFNNMKVSAKITLGFAIVILALMFVGFTGYRGISHVGDDFEGYAGQVTIADDVSDIDRHFQNYRRLAGEVSTHDDAELAKMAHEAEAGVKEAIERGTKQAKDPEERAKIEELSKQFEQYAELAHKSEKLHGEKMQITREVLDASDDKLIATFDELIASSASGGNSDAVNLANQGLKQLLLANKNVDRMLAIEDRAARTVADSAFSRMKDALAQLDKVITSPSGRKDYEELAKLAETYQAGYARAAGLDHELDELLANEMPKLATAIAGDTKAVDEKVSAEETRLEDDAMKSHQQHRAIDALVCHRWHGFRRRDGLDHRSRYLNSYSRHRRGAPRPRQRQQIRRGALRRPRRRGGRERACGPNLQRKFAAD